MAKSVIKEILIIILLIVVILLTLGIIFYDYNPTSKKIPTKAPEYVLPQEMSAELDETIKAAESQNIVKTYSVDASDLKGYVRSGDYEQGKENPFDKISKGTNGTGSSTTSSSSSESGSTTTGGNKTNRINEPKEVK